MKKYSFLDNPCALNSSVAVRVILDFDTSEFKLIKICSFEEHNLNPINAAKVV